MKRLKPLPYPLYFFILSLPILTLILSGCHADATDLTDTRSSDPFVSFTIQISSDQSSSRSGEEENNPDQADDWGHNPSPEYGNEFERKVELITPVLYLVDDNGFIDSSNPVGEMVDARYDYKSNGSLTISGRLQTRFTAEQLEDPGYKFRLAVFLNAPEIDINNPGGYLFTHSGAPSSFSSIPMYGVGKASFIGLSESAATEEKPFPIKNPSSENSDLEIPVLRAMAQVRVKVAKELYSSRDMHLESIAISRHAEKGYAVPARWNELESLLSLGMKESLNVWTSSFSAGQVIFPMVKRHDYEVNSYTMLRFYIPETYNSDGDDELKLTVNYTTDDPLEEKPLSNTIYFKEYDRNGHPTDKKSWDIIRNHIYEFVITGINPRTGELEITVDAEWWGEHQLELI